MGCGASKKTAVAGEESAASNTNEEISPERKALLEELERVEKLKEEKEKEKQRQEDEERIRQNALEDARLAGMSLASRADRFAQDLLYALSSGYIIDEDTMMNVISLYKIKCCNSDRVYFDYEPCLETAKMVLRNECGEKMKQKLMRDDIKLNRLPYSAVDFAEVLHRINYDMKIEDENVKPDIVSDFANAIMTIMLEDDCPESWSEQAAKVLTHLKDEKWAKYPAGVLDVHPEKRLQEEDVPEGGPREKQLEPANKSLLRASELFLTQYLRVVQHKGLDFKNRNKYLIETLKLSFNKCEESGSQEKFIVGMDAAIESNLVSTNLFGKCGELMKEDPVFNELYYYGFDVFELFHARVANDPTCSVGDGESDAFPTMEDAVCDLFDIFMSVALNRITLDVKQLETKLSESKWSENK